MSRVFVNLNLERLGFAHSSVDRGCRCFGVVHPIPKVKRRGRPQRQFVVICVAGLEGALARACERAVKEATGKAGVTHGPVVLGVGLQEGVRQRFKSGV